MPKGIPRPRKYDCNWVSWVAQPFVAKPHPNGRMPTVHQRLPGKRSTIPIFFWPNWPGRASLLQVQYRQSRRLENNCARLQPAWRCHLGKPRDRCLRSAWLGAVIAEPQRLIHCHRLQIAPKSLYARKISCKKCTAKSFNLPAPRAFSSAQSRIVGVQQPILDRKRDMPLLQVNEDRLQVGIRCVVSELRKELENLYTRKGFSQGVFGWNSSMKSGACIGGLFLGANQTIGDCAAAGIPLNPMKNTKRIRVLLPCAKYLLKLEITVRSLTRLQASAPPPKNR